MWFWWALFDYDGRGWMVVVVVVWWLRASAGTGHGVVMVLGYWSGGGVVVDSYCGVGCCCDELYNYVAVVMVILMC